MGTYVKRSYSGGARSLTLAATINSTTTTFTGSGTFLTWPTGATGPFVVCLTQGTSTEEKVTVVALNHATGVFSTVTRGFDGTAAKGHTHGATIKLVWSAHEAKEANRAAAAVPGLFSTKGDVVVGAGAHTATVLHPGTVGQALGVVATGSGKKLGYITLPTPSAAAPFGKAWATAGTTCPATTPVVVHLNDSVTAGGMTFTASNHRLIVPKTGKYLAIGQVSFNDAAVSTFAAYITHAGTRQTTVGLFGTLCAAMLTCTKNDYIALGVTNDTSSAKSTYALNPGATYLHVVWLTS